MKRPRFKSKFSKSPRKGTLAREAIRLALRPEGATASEILTAQGRDPKKASHRVNVSNVFTMATDMQGWDYRTYRCPPEREAGTSHARRPVVFKIVGKMRWDGGYRSFRTDLT